MSEAVDDLEHLRRKIAHLESQLGDLKRQLSAAENVANVVSPTNEPTPSSGVWKWPLEAEEYKRYGRQMIMPEIGLQGQLRLKKATVLIVGVGGLGCPAAAYLAGAGVGKLGLIDGDTVETSNLHRQILHSTGRVGMLKVDSAIDYLRQLNPKVEYVPHKSHLTPTTALDIFKSYDLILDCTDHPTSRYLISDAAVLSGTPLVSASALRTEGQLMVLNNPPTIPGTRDGGPCYRCVFPKPPPPASVLSCGEGGILGPVVGLMGVLMATEAIKVIVAGLDKSRKVESNGTDPSMRSEAEPSMSNWTGQPTSKERHSLLLYSAYGDPPFRSVRLRGKRARCDVCSDSPTITKDSLTSGSLDYAVFCGIPNPVNVLSKEERIDPQDFAHKVSGAAEEHVLVDVRDKAQFDICHIEGSINIPITALDCATGDNNDDSTNPGLYALRDSSAPIYAVCRFGNDSQLAVQKLKTLGYGDNGRKYIGDIRGGLRAWKEYVDPAWPEY
ncbi:MAG: molybdenum cofactor biosynthetic [Lasallia pustulata]|uniref:Adenylyltransferase and sulfurtransferase uba4 n=1 Tax=Lasallia pustulata TaxID=136370 RepID=A0A5M8PKI4_9LECA|nr:MAG: molybdenum cofactor biosynthetic [Lasallia pustulata]